MTKEFKKMLIFSAGIMIGLPIFFSLIFSLPATSGWGMVLTLFLFFIIDPIFTFWLGAFCSRDFKHYWSLPVINSLLCVVGTWIAFDFGNIDFFVYAAAYFCLGYAVMLIFSCFKYLCKR